MSENIQMALIISMSPTLAAIASIIVSLRNKNKITAVDSKLDIVAEKVENVHDNVNGKMQQLLDLTKVASKAEGKEEQRQDDKK